METQKQRNPIRNNTTNPVIVGGYKIEYLTMKEVCEIFRISLPTLTKWIRNGLIKSNKIGGRVLIHENQVKEAFNNGLR
jgi:excisionase family DNA binding protein